MEATRTGGTTRQQEGGCIRWADRIPCYDYYPGRSPDNRPAARPPSGSRCRPQLLLVQSDTEYSMARKRASHPSTPPPEPARPAVTPERFTRLYRLLLLLGKEPRTRE